MISFQEKTAVITGAGSGLGRAIAFQLARMGANLALVDLDQAGLIETQNLLSDPDVKTSTHEMDVSDQKRMKNLAATVLDIYGGADLLINNAGICLVPQLFEEIDPAQFKMVLDVNLWGSYYGIFYFLPQLRSKSEAAIVNISSLAGIQGLYGHSAYSMSKAGLKGLSEALQSELAGSGVQLTLVHPGGVKTNLIKNAPNLEEELQEKAHKNFTAMSYLSAEKTASKIIKGVQKKSNRVIIGLDARMIMAIRSLFPRAHPRIIRAIFSEANFKDDPSWKKDFS